MDTEEEIGWGSDGSEDSPLMVGAIGGLSTQKKKKPPDIISQEYVMVTQDPVIQLQDIKPPDLQRIQDAATTFQQYIQHYQNLVTFLLSRSLPTDHKFSKNGSVLDPTNIFKTQESVEDFMQSLGLQYPHFSSFPDIGENEENGARSVAKSLATGYQAFLSHLRNRDTMTFSSQLQDIFKTQEDTLPSSYHEARKEICCAQKFITLYFLKLKIKKEFSRSKQENMNHYQKVLRLFREIQRIMNMKIEENETLNIELRGEKLMNDFYSALEDYIQSCAQMHVFCMPISDKRTQQKYTTLSILPDHVKVQRFVSKFWNQRVKYLIAKIENLEISDSLKKVIVDYDKVKAISKMVNTFDNKTFQLQTLSEFSEDPRFHNNWKSVSVKELKSIQVDFLIPDLQDESVNETICVPSVSRPLPYARDIQIIKPSAFSSTDSSPGNSRDSSVNRDQSTRWAGCKKSTFKTNILELNKQQEQRDLKKGNKNKKGAFRKNFQFNPVELEEKLNAVADILKKVEFKQKCKAKYIESLDSLRTIAGDWTERIERIMFDFKLRPDDLEPGKGIVKVMLEDELQQIMDIIRESTEKFTLPDIKILDKKDKELILFRSWKNNEHHIKRFCSSTEDLLTYLFSQLKDGKWIANNFHLDIEKDSRFSYWYSKGEIKLREKYEGDYVDSIKAQNEDNFIAKHGLSPVDKEKRAREYKMEQKAYNFQRHPFSGWATGPPSKPFVPQPTSNTTPQENALKITSSPAQDTTQSRQEAVPVAKLPQDLSSSSSDEQHEPGSSINSRKRIFKKKRRVKFELSGNDGYSSPGLVSGSGSVEGSIFDQNAINQIVRKLQDTLKLTKDIADKNSTEKVKTDFANKEIIAAISYAESKGHQWIQTGQGVCPADEEKITDLLSDLRSVQLSLLSNLQSISEADDQKRAQCRSVLPTFNGEASLYQEWSKRIDQATKFKTDEERRDCLLSSLQGSRGRWLRGQLEFLTSYSLMKKNMDELYQKPHALYPGQWSILKGLKTPAEDDYQGEANNINQFLRHWFFLKSHKIEYKWDAQSFWLLCDRLRSYNRNVIETHFEEYEKDWELLFTQLQIFSKMDHERLGRCGAGLYAPLSETKNQSRHQGGGEHDGSRGRRPDDHPGGQRGGAPRGRGARGGARGQAGGRTGGRDQRPRHGGHSGGYSGNNVRATQQSSSSIKCQLCSEDHLNYKCPLLSAGDKNEAKSVVKQKGLCLLCLRPISDKCKDKKCGIIKLSNGKEIKLTCPCGSNVNKGICCHRYQPNQDGQSTHVRVTGGTGAIVVNQVPLGKSSSLLDNVHMKLKNGETKEVLFLYDNAAESSVLSTTLMPYLEECTPVTWNCHTVSSSEIVHGFWGKITILNNDGEEISIEGLVQDLQNNYHSPKTLGITEEWKERFNLNDEIRVPGGSYEVILGSDLIGLHPSHEADSGAGLAVYRSKITGAQLFCGYNRLDKEKGDSKNIQKNERVAQCEELSITEATPVSTHTRVTRNEELDTQLFNPIFDSSLHQIDVNFLNLHCPEQLAFNTKLCDACLNKKFCRDCKMDENVKTLLETQEEKILKEGVTFDEKKGKYYVKNSYKSNLPLLPTYREEAKKRNESLAAKLRRCAEGSSIAEELDNTVNSNISQGVYTWEKNWLQEDPSRKHLQESFCPNGYALKISGSTKVRLVHDMSFSTPGNISVNETHLKGNSLNRKISHILLLHRLYENYSVADIKRFYNSVELSPRDCALQKFWWKEGGILSEDPWIPVVPKCLQFGGTSSQCLSQVAKLDANDRFLSDRPDLQFWIERSYSDDICLANNDLTLDKMMEDQKIIERAMAKANFHFKAWQNAKQEVQEDQDPVKTLSADNYMSKHLGVKWDILSDDWFPSIALNCSKRVRGVRSPKFNLQTEEDIEQYVSKHGLTKKQCLGVAHIQFDPCSIWICTQNAAKILYRDLIKSSPSLKWTDKIDSRYLPNWKKLMKQLLEIQNTKTPRCALPKKWREGVSLAIACDGSNSCSTARCFLRADTPDEETGRHDVRYLTGSSKLAETSVSAATKTEANSLKIACNLARLVVETCRSGPGIEFSNIYIISDSEVILTMCNSDPAKLKLWYQSRLAEAQFVIKEYGIKLLWAPSSKNDADKSSKLNLDSNPALQEEYWSSIFLTLPYDSWPIKERMGEPDKKTLDIIEESKMKILSTGASEDFLHKLIEKLSWKKLVITLAFIYLWKEENFTAAKQKALDKLYCLAQPTESQIKNMEKKFLVQNEDDKRYLITRPFTIEEKQINFKYILLNGDSDVGKSILRSLHIHVSSPEREYAKMLDQGLMITKAKQFFRRLQHTCTECTRIRMEATQAKMGPSPVILAQAEGPFSNCCIDIWGPFKIKVTRNSSMPGYLLTTTDLYTRFCQFSLMVDCTADSLLTALKQTIYQVNGRMPLRLYSDSGRQILPIRSLETEEDNQEGLDMSSVRKTLRKNGIDLITSTSAPYRQTGAESLHRVLRLNMKRSRLSKQHRYTLAQWNYIASFMSFTVNQRPLSIVYQDQVLRNLTPACLIYGRKRVDTSTDLDIDNPRLFGSLQKLEDELKNWHQMWSQSYLTEILRWTKWKKDENQLKKGSICLVTDHKCKDSKLPAMAIVVEELSPRSFRLKYVKRQAEYDKDFNMTKKPLYGFLFRPNSKLVKILDQADETERSVDPFDIVSSTGLLPVARGAPDDEGDPEPVQEDADMEVLPEQRDEREVARAQRAQEHVQRADDPELDAAPVLQDAVLDAGQAAAAAAAVVLPQPQQPPPRRRPVVTYVADKDAPSIVTI